MLKLKPSERMKKRYLLLEGSRESVEKAILDYIGILGWSKASPVFLENKEKLILAINRKEISNIIASLAISADKIKVLKVSGTLRGLR